MNSLKLIVLPLFLVAYTATAQTADQDIMQNGTVDEQFDYVLQESNRYKEGNDVYRVIQNEMFFQLESNVDEAIAVLEEDLTAANQTIETQQEEITGLQAELESTNESLTKVTKEKDNMSFLGVISMKKAAYRGLMWLIIAGLVICLVGFIFSFLRSNAITRQTKKTLDKTREEFDAYKKKSMEEELVLRRKLQTEINKRL